MRNILSSEPSFQYNPEITNINIDNQLAAILSQFDDDYILDIVEDSLENRYRPLELAMPNVVAGYETTFKHLTNGFATYTSEIIGVRERVYRNIINKICGFYNLEFTGEDDTDWYSAAFWVYKFFVSEFTSNMITFYTMYIIREKDELCNALGLLDLRKENDQIFSYSKRLFSDVNLAAVHANLNHIINQIQTFDIDLYSILSYVYDPTIARYIASIVRDQSNFFRDQYEGFIMNPKNNADMITNIKMNLQQIGSQISPMVNNIAIPNIDEEMENVNNGE